MTAGLPPRWSDPRLCSRNRWGHQATAAVEPHHQVEAQISACLWKGWQLCVDMCEVTVTHKIVFQQHITWSENKEMKSQWQQSRKQAKNVIMLFLAQWEGHAWKVCCLVWKETKGDAEKHVRCPGWCGRKWISQIYFQERSDLFAGDKLKSMKNVTNILSKWHTPRD